MPSESPHDPVSIFPRLLLDSDRQTILKSNIAIEGLRRGIPAEPHLTLLESDGEWQPARFLDKWWMGLTTAGRQGAKEVVELKLLPRKDIPDPELIRSMKELIAQLLHRFRSPLTGMQGYLELMEGSLNEKNRNRLTRVGEGIDQLLDLLDELETLHPVLSSGDVSLVTPEEAASKLLENHPAASSGQIRLSRSSEGEESRWPAALLIRTLDELLTNALEHCGPNAIPVDLQIEAGNLIHLSHKGQPVPDEQVNRLFFPFVTGRVDRLGIGLTRAHLMSDKMGGNIFLTRNRLNDVRFTLALPQPD